MNFFQKLARNIIEISFNLSVTTIERCSTMQPYYKKVAKLRALGQGTLGKEIANCLDAQGLTLVPKYESHDLKHVLLDYKMTPEDEIRMQAFMIGNGNYSVPSFVIFFFGALLLPDLYSTFYTDFKKGSKTIPISSWTIEEYANKPLNELRKMLTTTKRERNNSLQVATLVKYAAAATIAVGALGMLYCFPYLFSANIADLVGAGFPFVGGAVLVVGGLIALSNIALSNMVKGEYTTK